MKTNRVQIYIQFNNKILIIPVNPESITPSRSASNDDIDIIGLGKATRKGEPGLTGFTIESFFPSSNSIFYTGVRPKAAVSFINEIWETENINNNVAKITITGISIPVNMYFVIQNFEYDHRAGEEEDIYYTLEIKKYIPYGVKYVEATAINNTNIRVASPNIEVPQSSNSQQTYSVKSGDSLFAITKKYTGSGNKWKELYELNKDKIKNPNLIYPNQKLTIPSGW